MTICPHCHERYDERADGVGTCPCCRASTPLGDLAGAPERPVRTRLAEQDPMVYQVAMRLLAGDRSTPPAAWQLRRELMQRTWAWPVAQRLVVDRHRRRSV